MKRLLFTSMLLIGISFFSCDRGGSVRNEYLVKSIVTSYGLLNEEGAIDSLSIDSLGTDELMRFSDLVLTVRVDETELASLTKPKSGLGNAAYADPAPPRAKHRLAYIKVSSERPLYTKERNYQPSEDLEGVFGFASNPSNGFQSVYSYLGDMGNSWNQYEMVSYIKFMGELTQPVDQSLTIIYRFTDDSEVSTTTATIKAN